MPKQHLHIPRFDGMYGGADARDLPLTTGAFSLNVDPLGVEGKLSPVKAPGLALAGAGGRAYAVRGDGTEAIFAHGSGSSSVIKRLTGIGSTLAVSTIHTPGAGETDGSICTASDGQAVHVGMGAGETYLPKWVGEITHGQLWDGADYARAAPAGVQVEDAQLVHHEQIRVDDSSPVVTTAGSEEDVVFPYGYSYRYSVSLIYADGQEGPLGAETPTGAVVGSAPGASQITFTVQIDLDDLPPRVRHVAIYRRSYPFGSRLAGDPVLVTTLDLASTDDTWVFDIGTGFHELSVTDTGDDGGSYEERTGIPATLDHMQVHYAISCASDGYHFVGGCWHPDFDAATYVFRSLPYRYDTFVWSQDYLRLPFTPVALVPFDGKIFAFGEGRYVTINPVTLAIMDEYDGAGTFSQESVCVTEKGMFFVSRDNLYFHDRRAPVPIGAPILRNEYVPLGSLAQNDMDVSWLALTHESRPVCLYDSARDAFVVIFSTDDPDTANPVVWGILWSVAKQRYDYFQTSSIASIDGRFMAANGAAYVSLGGDLYELFTGNALSWTYVTKKITNENALKAKFYHARVVGEVSSISYSEDEGEWRAAAYSTDGDGVVKATINSEHVSDGDPWKIVRSLQVRMSGSGEVESLGITFRPMGAR